MMIPAAALLALLLQTPDSAVSVRETAVAADSVPIPTDSYADSGASDLVERTRAYAQATKSDIEAYRLLSQYTFSMGLSTGRRDRLLYRRELAWKVSWRRDEEWRVDIVASRETLPLFLRAPRVGDFDDELSTLNPDFIIGNRGQWILEMPASGDRSNLLYHPLAPLSERHYYFATGDTTRIQLPDRGPLTLVELKITPRRADSRLLIGSWWLDVEIAAPVRAALRLGTPARFPIDGAGRRILPGVDDFSFNIDYITLEYALWEDRWWLPRLLSLQGRGSGAGVDIPILIEQTFEDLELFAADDAWAPLPEPDTTLFKVVDEENQSVLDVPQQRRTYAPMTDSLLLSSPYLAHSPYEIGSSISGVDLDWIMSALDVRLPAGVAGPPEFSWSPFNPGLMRYNRVEGFAFGSTARLRHGALTLGATARLGVAGPTPSGSISLKQARPRSERTIRLYSDIAAFTPADRPLAIGNSANALLLGNDDGDYYRASGVTAGIEGRFSRFNWSEIGLTAFAENQTPLERNTGWSFAEWSGGDPFRPNPAADRATQVGLEAVLGMRTGVEASRFRAGASLRTSAEMGSFRFAKASIDGYVGFPLPLPLVAGLEVGAGQLFGSAPVQDLWYVGGSSTVRGFRPEDRISGTAFWRGRAEIATEKPALRGLVFIDSGYAGAGFRGVDPALISAGVGLSAMDGLVRVDIARAIRGGEGWGLQLYLDAPL